MGEPKGVCDVGHGANDGGIAIGEEVRSIQPLQGRRHYAVCVSICRR
jgi:hypothetical protein